MIKQQERRERVILSQEQFLPWCLNHWMKSAQEAIQAHGRFLVALSGGSTPKQLYEALAMPEWRKQVDWKRVFLLWSDERAVAPDHPESNYHMAMQAGLGKLGIPQEQIFRMQAESEIVLHAKEYAENLKRLLEIAKIDLIMLGMGEDGHIASLFPGTSALLESQQLVAANFVPKLDSWRMTMTYPAFAQAQRSVLYVTGSGKAEVVRRIWEENADFPAGAVGTLDAPALWILDEAAAGVKPAKRG